MDKHWKIRKPCHANKGLVDISGHDAAQSLMLACKFFLRNHTNSHASSLVARREAMCILQLGSVRGRCVRSVPDFDVRCGISWPNIIYFKNQQPNIDEMCNLGAYESKLKMEEI